MILTPFPFFFQDEALRDWAKSFSADPIHTYKGKPIPRGIRYVMKFCASVNADAFKDAEEDDEEQKDEKKKSTPLSPKKKHIK